MLIRGYRKVARYSQRIQEGSKVPVRGYWVASKLLIRGYRKVARYSQRIQEGARFQSEDTG